jgi:hypothetical protein
VLVISAGVVALDRYLDVSGKLVGYNGVNRFLFDDLPRHLSVDLMHLQIICWIIVAFLLKSLFIVYFAHDLLLQFSNRRRGAFASLRSLKMRSVLVFFGLQCAVYIFFGLVALALFVLATKVWTAGHSFAAGIVIIPFLMLYPLFYISLSLSAFVSVLSEPMRMSLRLVWEFARPTMFWKTYLFYLGRSVVDYSCLFVVPLVILMVTRNWIISTLLIAISLSIPIALVRTSSFAFKLRVLSAQVCIRNLFGSYYRDTEGLIEPPCVPS